MVRSRASVHVTAALAVLSIQLSVAVQAGGQVVTVPGTADIVLAGQPDGTTLGGDSAPQHSPPFVTVPSGAHSVSFAADGGTSIDPGSGLVPADGVSGSSWGFGGVLGIASTHAPQSALVGVFLATDPPAPGSEPVGLDFSSAGLGVNFEVLAPELQQPFFIGDGRSSAGFAHRFTVPSGAARLFLGTVDCHGCFWNNHGDLRVVVSIESVPLEIQLSTDKTSYGTGDNCEVRLRIANATADSVGPFEVKLFAVLPNGNRRGLVNEASVTYVPGTDETTLIGRHRWRGSEPAGTYSIELRFLDPVTGDLLLPRRLSIEYEQ